MKQGSFALALAGALASLVIPLGASFNLPALQGGGLITDPNSVRLLGFAVSLVAVLSVGIVGSRPIGGSLTLFACAEVLVILLGFGGLVVLPVMLLGAAGISGLMSVQSDSVDKDAAGPFGFRMPQAIALLMLVFLVTCLPFMLYPVFLMRLLCFALFACAFNLLLGYVGLMSFGHAAYFGMGSYVTAWTAKNWGLTPEIAILLGGLTGGTLGLAFGKLAIRRQGIYFAMITLALAQMNYFFCLQATDFTGGEDGIQQVPRGFLFGLFSLRSDLAMYCVVAVIFLVFFVLIHRTVHSPFGQVLKAIRENEARTTSLGYRVDDYKLIAFVLSCFIAGIAGGTKSIVFGIATLTDVNYGLSGEVVLMTLLGGLGTIFGPVVGAGVLVSLENYLAQAGSWPTVLQGAIFIICVLAFRRGIVGEVAARVGIRL